MWELYLLQKATAFLLQNEPFLLHYAAGIAKYAVFIKKTRQVLKNAPITTKRGTTAFVSVKNL